MIFLSSLWGFGVVRRDEVADIIAASCQAPRVLQDAAIKMASSSRRTLSKSLIFEIIKILE